MVFVNWSESEREASWIEHLLYNVNSFAWQTFNLSLKLLNSFADDLLFSRLQNYFSANNDYDYTEGDDTSEPTQFTLPILNDSDTNNEPQSNESSSQHHKIESNGGLISNTTTDFFPATKNTTHENRTGILSWDHSTTEVTELPKEDTDLLDLSNEAENYPQTTMSEQQSTVPSDDYLNTILFSESLLIDQFDYDVTTLASDDGSADGSGESGVFQTTPEYQNLSLEISTGSSKFVHHPESLEHTTNKPSTAVRFPTSGEVQLVRFPDNTIGSTSISFPRENRYQLMRFWRQQPLINDFKSRGFSGVSFRKY